MMTMTADGRMTKPEKFDVKLVLKTSRLIKDFPPLENMPLVMAVVDLQLAEQQLAGLNSQALARDLVDVIGTTDQNANANPVVLARNATSSPTPAPADIAHASTADAAHRHSPTTPTPPPSTTHIATPSSVRQAPLLPRILT